MIGGNSSSIFRSGSTEYPSHEDLIRGLLCKLVIDDKWEWVHFEAEDHRHCLEIADEEDLLLINLPFPFTKSLEETFRQASLTFPATWQLTAFRERGWWRAGYAELAAPHHVLARSSSGIGGADCVRDFEHV